MSDMTHPVLVDGRWVHLPVAAMGGEALVVPNVAALVHPPGSPDSILLQRRDKPGEAVRGRLEIPMGRWRAGETPSEAVVREVEEETGLRVIEVAAAGGRHEAAPNRPFLSVTPLAVTIGVEGAYPALHLAFACVAEGDPRPAPGETSEPGWYQTAEVRRMIEAPERFTGPALAILASVLAG